MKWFMIREEHGGPDTWRPDISIERNWGSGKEFAWSALGEKGQTDSLQQAHEAAEQVVLRHYATADARTVPEVTEHKRKRLVAAGAAYDDASRKVSEAEDLRIECASALNHATAAQSQAEKDRERCLKRWEEEKER